MKTIFTFFLLLTSLGFAADSGQKITPAAPLAFSGGLLSIPKSSSIQDGYLGLGDFAIFLAKQPAGAYLTALSGDVTASGPGAGVATLSSSAVTNAKLANMADQRVKGNISGGSAAPSDLTSAQVTAFLANFVGDSGSGGTKGLVPAPASGDAAALKYLGANGQWSVVPGSMASITSLTGDVTAAGPGAAAATIAANAVSFAKIQNIATARLVGRSTAGTGNLEVITVGTGLSLSGGTLSATGGGVTIGSPVNGGSANRLLYGDASQNVAESTNLRFDGNQLGIPGGNAGAPSLYNAIDGNDNSGIFFPGSGSGFAVGISYLGTERLRFDMSAGQPKIDARGAFGILTNNGTPALYWDSNALQAIDFGAVSGAKMGKYASTTQPFLSANFGTAGVAIGIPYGGSYINPNYQLDIRGGASPAVIQLTDNSSGTTSADGGLLQWDNTIGLKLASQEVDKPIILSTEGIDTISIGGTSTSGRVTFKNAQTGNQYMFIQDNGGGGILFHTASGNSVFGSLSSADSGRMLDWGGVATFHQIQLEVGMYAAYNNLTMGKAAGNEYSFVEGHFGGLVLGATYGDPAANSASGALTSKQISTPANPDSGFDRLYFKSDDNLYKKTSGGTENQMITSSGLSIVEGANTRQNTCTLVGGTCTITNTSVAANDRIYCTSQVDGGTPGFIRVSGRNPGTDYTVTSSSVIDTSTIACLLVGAL